MLDIATGFALELEPSYRGEKLWVPVSYERIAVYGDLTQELRSHVRVRPREKSSGFARFDIVLADAEGRVLVEVEGFSMQEIAGDFFEASEPRPQDLEVDGPRRELSTAERAFLHNLREGTTREEGVAAFRRLVDTMPRARVMVSSIDVRKLIQQADALSVAEKPASSVATFERPDLSSEYVAPRTDVERALAGIWENLLGVSRVGVRDDFFELGGHSLIAVRLFARMKKTFGVDYPISTLFERPTIEGCASLIAPSAEVSSSAETVSESDEPKARYKHVVPMSPPHAKNADKLPFFLVSGMFGNVMNLRHLASLVGEDRPFHGIQARGLLGDEEPHETFEEMARDYLVELRRVQPHGPYLLGGFSGGGLAAFEMARQLLEQGEEVPLLVMLDTPLPKDEPLTRAERLSIHRQNFARLGAKYPLQWAAEKVAYKKSMREREQALHEQKNQEGANFRSQLIEAAFYRALSRYNLEPLPVRILLCRPRLKPAYEFGPGRAINHDRRRIYHDNGWTPYGGKVEVFETPGDHDSMVLEPNVRILAARLRPALQEAQGSAESKATRPAEAAGTTLGVSDV